MQKSNKSFIIVGDPHLNHSRVSTRIDDISLTALEKLEQIRDYAVKNNISTVILLGDVFHKIQQNNYYINKVLSKFNNFRMSNIDVYSIIGNHDILQDRLDSIEKSPLQILFISGLIKNLHFLDFKWCEIYGFDYSQPVTKIENKKTNKKYFCCAHMFYEFGDSKDSLTTQNIIDLDYDYYLLGHDHITYDDENIEGHIITRPGSLLRGTSHSYNMTKRPCFDVFSFQNNEVVKTRVELKCLTAEEIFTHQAINKKQKVFLEYNIIDKVDELILKMQHTEKEESIYSILDSLDMSKTAKQILTTYFEAKGILR